MNLFNPIVIVSKLVIFIYTGSWKTPPKDRLSSTLWWKIVIQRQVERAQRQKYQAALFGDSITAPLKNSLGRQVGNLAVTAMSTRSLVEQLQTLSRAQVECEIAIVAIGTNDAWYDIDDQSFLQLMKKAVNLIRLMGAGRIILLPAFYSSAAAAKNPFRAGTIARVEEINALLRQVAISEEIYFAEHAVQVLFENQTMKPEFTGDGVHLNASGLKVYRQVLLELISKE